MSAGQGVIDTLALATAKTGQPETGLEKVEQAGFIPWRSWYAAASAFQAHGHPELAETIAAMNEAELMTLSHYIERHLRTERVGDIFEP